MDKRITKQYLKTYGVTTDSLIVNDVEQQKAMDFQQKKLALINEKIKTIRLILSVLVQVMNIFLVIVPVEVCSTELNKNVEPLTIELDDDHINKN